MDRQLNSLSAEYKAKNDGKRTVRDLYRKYIGRREKALIDSAALAAGLSAVFYGDSINMSAVNPQMEEAFHLAFPEKSFSELESMDAEQLSGIISAWKGKYFEVMVRDDLISGEFVGDIHLEPGQTAELAESVTQPGWDLQILNDDGTVAQEISLKATESLSYVKEALERYPDIQILTTDEVAANADAAADMILNSGILNNDLEQAVAAPMASLFDTVAQDVMEAILPGLPFIIIAVGEGRHILTGKRTFQQVLPAILKRSMITGVSMGAGFVTGIFLPDVFGILAGIAVRIGFSRYENAENSVIFLDKKTELLLPMSSKYITN